MRVLFLTTAHKYDDDRIFYHQAKELNSQGFEVKICSLNSECKAIVDGIQIESYKILDHTNQYKIRTLQSVCEGFQPDCIICSEPLAVVAAKKFAKDTKTAIVYDITEWYPSYRMLQGYSFFSKIINYIKFFLIQLYVGFVSTHFIFGEESKRYPLAYVFPFKKKLMLPYYPDEKYIHKNIKTPESNKITLCYTGRISKEDGIGNFFSAVNILRNMRPNLGISVLIIGAPKKEDDQKYFSDLLHLYSFENVLIKKPVKFEFFTEAYTDADLCFDLREKNPEYNLSLPIKLFYYIASGKPVIYSNLKAIEKHIDVKNFGHLTDPEDSESIAHLIAGYSDNHQLYLEHAKNARSAFEEKYNWKLIKKTFIDFVKTSKN